MVFEDIRKKIRKKFCVEIKKSSIRSKKNAKKFAISQIFSTFAPLFRSNGALAHLARAFDWQSRGGEFESRMLHKKNVEYIIMLAG